MVKSPPANEGDTRYVFDPCAVMIPWRREWQPTPVFLPGRDINTVDREAWRATVHAVTESDMTEHAHTHKVITFISPNYVTIKPNMHHITGKTQIREERK